MFSFAIEIPEHRQDYDAICIEHLYQDEVLRRSDKDGRRIYFRNEFYRRNGFHKTDKAVLLTPKSKNPIVDSNVFHRDTGDSLALSKDNFAECIFRKMKPFDQVDFSAFKSIFDTIQKIRADVLSSKQYN